MWEKKEKEEISQHDLSSTHRDSEFFTDNSKMSNITPQSERRSIDGTGNFRNTPYNRFGLVSLQWRDATEIMNTS